MTGIYYLRLFDFPVFTDGLESEINVLVGIDNERHCGSHEGLLKTTFTYAVSL
jgi:hypothetical protein